ncbi:MAG: hypothetical protein JST59_18425 [Actinobacteria bacterium]|nr:hypothetical protein [Actinomycetota bacterium]
MTDGTFREKDGATWRIGTDAEVAWVRAGTDYGVRIDCAVPTVFEAYATLELPGTGDHEPGADWPKEEGRHDAAVMSILGEHTAPQAWWLGFLETGSADIVFPDAPKVTLYAQWDYVLVEAGPVQAATWRDDDIWGENLPDLMFPADRSWLFTTLWDDDWSCLGGSRALVDGFLDHPDLAGRIREVTAADEDITPPGHVAI